MLSATEVNESVFYEEGRQCKFICVRTKIIPSIRKFKTTEYTLEGRSTRQEILKNTVHAIRQVMSTRQEILKKIQYMLLDSECPPDQKS